MCLQRKFSGAIKNLIEMKHIKLTYAFLLIFSVMLSSCVDDSSFVDEVKSTPNLIGFELRNTNVSGIADGTEYTKVFNVEVVGPTSYDLTGNITATVTVDPSSTAVEGTHFRIDNPAIAVSKEGNLRTTFAVTMLSTGISTPLAENPILILNVTNASGSGDVVASGAQLVVNMLYLCPSDLADYTYNISGQYVRVNSGIDQVFTQTSEVFTVLAPGQFRTTSTGIWGAGALSPPANYDGFNFTDVCGVITIPQQNLGGYYSNQVAGNGSVDAATGTITMSYTVCASDCREYIDCKYTRR
jgi:hypothetical protein